MLMRSPAEPSWALPPAGRGAGRPGTPTPARSLPALPWHTHVPVRRGPVRGAVPGRGPHGRPDRVRPGHGAVHAPHPPGPPAGGATTTSHSYQVSTISFTVGEPDLCHCPRLARWVKRNPAEPPKPAPKP